LTIHYNVPNAIIDDEAYDILYNACEDKKGNRQFNTSDGVQSQAHSLSDEDEDVGNLSDSSGSVVYCTPRTETPMMEGSCDSNEEDEHDASTIVTSKRKTITWSTKDPVAPGICGSAQLKAITQSRCLKRIQSNGKGAIYSCVLCERFWRKFVWDARCNKDQRLITVRQPDDERFLNHTSDCPRASLPWEATIDDLPPGEILSLPGREWVVMMIDGGIGPASITETLNASRLVPESYASLIFPHPVTVELIRNIGAYQTKKLRQQGGTGPAYMMDRNAGVKAWCQEKHFEQGQYFEVCEILRNISRAEEEVQRDALIGELRCEDMANKLFVVDTCKDQDGKVLGVVFSSALICLNLHEAIRKLGVDGINISLDGTFELSKAGWAVITLGTHSIQLQPGSRMLSHKSRPFVYAFAFSESTAVFTKMDQSVKLLAWKLFTAKIGRFPAVAMDHCEAARIAFVQLNRSVKILLDWTHVIMNARKHLPKIYDDSCKSQLKLMLQQSVLKDTAAEPNLHAHHRDCDQDPCVPLSERSKSGEINVKHTIINRMMNDMRALHRARNLDQFRVLASLVLKKWRETYLQQESADWLEKYYVTDAWSGFYAAASGIIGVTPSTQHLESLHHHLKQLVVHKRRYSNDHMYGYVLQCILSNHSNTFVGDIQRAHSHLSASSLLLANEIIQFNKTNANFNIRNTGSGPVQMYFNVTPITSSSTPLFVLNHQGVSEERIKLYEDGLQGLGKESESVDTFLKLYMSLYKVVQNVGEAIPVCDCKDFYRLFHCAHSIVYRHAVNGENVLNIELGLTPTVKTKSGKRISYHGREGGSSKSATKAKVYIHVYMHACMHAYVCKLRCTYIYTYIHTYIRM
jgi:hypothetical protein